jgi:transcriptional regulator with XRE-family HTH domain
MAQESGTRLHKIIKQIREDSNLNQVEFSKTLGVSQGYISKIEAGLSKSINIKVLIVLRKVYNLDINNILEKLTITRF